MRVIVPVATPCVVVVPGVVMILVRGAHSFDLRGDAYCAFAAFSKGLRRPWRH
jgi:hypothetical protein